MTNKELIEILHNIPKEVFQSKNHEKLRLVFHCKEPRLKLFTSNDYEVLELTLYESMQYTIWTPRSFEDIKNQVKSYLDILGFTEKGSLFDNGLVISDKDFCSISKNQLIQELIKSV